MVCGYARVSTKIQEKNGNSLDAQEDLLRDSGARLVYKESCSGGTLDRPQLNELLHALEPGDTLMVTKLDRLARSASQGIAFINKLLGHGIKVHVLNMGLMDNTPTGKLIRTILLAFAEFERDMIVERTQEGRKISGHYGGRPLKYGQEQLDPFVQFFRLDPDGATGHGDPDLAHADNANRLALQAHSQQIEHAPLPRGL